MPVPGPMTVPMRRPRGACRRVHRTRSNRRRRLPPP
jgi:hypothetical protein